MSLTVKNSICDVLGIREFSGYARFILPLDRNNYDEAMPLGDIATLMPYHNYVNASHSVEIINEMTDLAQEQKLLFYNYYDNDETQKDPRKKSTGLFFFKGNPKSPFAVICAGGGFSYIASVHEAFPYAIKLQKKGYNAFVLQYRVGGAHHAYEDLSASIDFILGNMKELGMENNDYSLWGSSAGGRMVATIASSSPAAFGNYVKNRPSTVILAYTGHTQFTQNDPPTYSVVGSKDEEAYPSLMKKRTEELQKLGIDAELHIFEGMRHGFGDGFGTIAEGWDAGAELFWNRHQ